jgi:hypothetical protein
MLEDRKENGGGISFTHGDSEKRSWLPWIVAGAIIFAAVGVLIAIGGRGKPVVANPGPGLAPPDAYAAHLGISDIHMSEASNFAGGKMTYIDGKIANRGDKTLDSVTVQVAFRNALNEIGQKETLPLSLIRTHEPYVDTEPVGVAPLKPGDEREFRLIFESVPADWNQQYPEIRVVQTASK